MRRLQQVTRLRQPLNHRRLGTAKRKAATSILLALSLFPANDGVQGEDRHQLQRREVPAVGAECLLSALRRLWVFRAATQVRCRATATSLRSYHGFEMRLLAMKLPAVVPLTRQLSATCPVRG